MIIVPFLDRGAKPVAVPPVKAEVTDIAGGLRDKRHKTAQRGLIHHAVTELILPEKSQGLSLEATENSTGSSPPMLKKLVVVTKPIIR